jgi:hypothetical protein
MRPRVISSLFLCLALLAQASTAPLRAPSIAPRLAALLCVGDDHGSPTPEDPYRRCDHCLLCHAGFQQPLFCAPARAPDAGGADPRDTRRQMTTHSSVVERVYDSHRARAPPA